MVGGGRRDHDEPFTREYSVEDFGTNYIYRVRFRLGFKVSQSIPAYIHQIMHDLSKTGELPKQKSISPQGRRRSGTSAPSVTC